MKSCFSAIFVLVLSTLACKHDQPSNLSSDLRSATLCGSELERKHNVPVLSNGDNQGTGYSCDGKLYDNNGEYVGLGYQCKEYAFRYARLRFGAPYVRCDAGNCFDNPEVLKHFRRLENGSATPYPGDLIVFQGGSVPCDSGPCGHIGVISEVNPDTKSLTFLSQNWTSATDTLGFNPETNRINDLLGYATAGVLRHPLNYPDYFMGPPKPNHLVNLEDGLGNICKGTSQLNDPNAATSQWVEYLYSDISIWDDHSRFFDPSQVSDSLIKAKCVSSGKHFELLDHSIDTFGLKNNNRYYIAFLKKYIFFERKEYRIGISSPSSDAAGKNIADAKVYIDDKLVQGIDLHTNSPSSKIWVENSGPHKIVIKYIVDKENTQNIGALLNFAFY